MLPLSRIIATLSISMLLAMSGTGALAQADDQKPAVNPLRLSYISGSVSFWRYGAKDWVEARINTPLTAGDALYAGKNAELELQAEGRAFIRADDDTQISLMNQTPDYLQLKITSGRVSLDFRTLPSPGYTVEVDTPNAVFTIDHTGYYRVDVDGDVHFITRRGGRAMMTPAGGEPLTILPSEEIVVRQGTDMARASTYAAPELDEWDRWNYERTNDLVDALSERYLPAGVAGARDLDHYGNWRVTDDYGPVWIPDAMPSDWAPYSTGRWVWDPYYQWTWIDDAPWGWAPYHYGRWIYLGGYWAWAPGPVVLRRPVYAPALVAFFGISSRVSVGASFGGPGFGWVALGWGEPCVPWWGRSGFVGRPWWGGWGGPRVVNNVVVRQTTVVNVTNITYINSRVSNAIIATPSKHFGREHVREASDRLRVQPGELEHIHGALPLKPNASNLVADAPTGVRPPEQTITRPVVATRRPQDVKLPWHNETPAPKATEQRYVPAPKPAATDLRRPELGTQTGPERVRPPLPPRYEEWKRQAEPVSPPDARREPGNVGTIESRPARTAPADTTTPPRGRELSPGPIPAITPERQQQQPRVDDATRQPIRVAPPETATPSRREREVTPTTPAPMRTEPQQRQLQMPRIEAVPQPERIAPQERQLQIPRNEARQPIRVQPPPSVSPPRGGEFSSPSPAPARIAPQERQQQMPRIESAPQEIRPQGGRTDLPGTPANRTYRRGNQEKPERERPQQ